MLFTNDVFLKTAIFLLGLCGLFVARHIYKHKNNDKKPLVCPIKFDCHGVVHSDYSKFLGASVDVLGIVYYSFISAAYFFLVVASFNMSLVMMNVLLGISLGAMLFSLYLIGVQVFAIKKGCSWCIVSAIISTLIFGLSLVSYNLINSV